ncbi:MAG: penicillin-binding protein activator [Dehalobacterium sp.]
MSIIKTSKMLVLATMILFFAVALLGCGSGAPAGGESGESGESQEPIKIGLVQPLSGGSAYDGQNVTNGFNLAAEEINQAGGLLGGRPIKVLVEDTATDPATGVAAAVKLITKENICALGGAFNSSVTGAVAAEAEKNGTPMITGISTSPTLTEQGYQYFFRMNGTSVLFAKAFAKKIVKDLDVKRIAFIYENGDWGRNSVLAFSDAIKELGGTILTEQVINPGETDITSQMTAIKNENPDAIYAVANTAYAILITNTAAELNITPDVKLFGEGAWTSEEYMKNTANNNEGIYAVVEYMTEIDNDINKKFVEAYQAKYNTLPDKYGAAGYRMMKNFALAIEKANSTDPDAIRDALCANPIETFVGTYTYDENGQAHGFNMYLARIENGVPTLSVVAPVE